MIKLFCDLCGEEVKQVSGSGFVLHIVDGEMCFSATIQDEDKSVKVTVDFRPRNDSAICLFCLSKAFRKGGE